MIQLDLSTRAKAKATDVLRPNFRNYNVTSVTFDWPESHRASSDSRGGEHHSSGTVEKNLQPFFLSHTSLVFCSCCSLNTFNRVILFLELENYSSFEIQKFLISRQIRKLKEDRKKYSTHFSPFNFLCVLCFLNTMRYQFPLFDKVIKYVGGP